MPDREKVIKGLECCTKWDSCSDCPYQTPNEYDVSECTEQMHKDTLELLKEQENELTNEEALRFIEKLKSDNNELREKYSALLKSQPQIVRCMDCKHYKDGFCYNPNTYDDEKTRGNTVPDWFCADGERMVETAI